MKQRMLNTFTRKLKIRKLAEIAANAGYIILQVFYVLARMFLHWKNDEKLDSNTMLDEAYTKINEIRVKPQMNDIIVNKKQDEEMDLSIVMPAYNVEKYIKECIESIINQRTKYKYELLIINDGATDNTDQIVRKIQDEHIKYIIQENKGLSGARNTGINNSVGKYIMFVDSDDVMCDGSIEAMMDAIINNGADISVGGYYLFTDETDKQYFIDKARVIDNDSSEAVKNPGYAWGKIYKRSLFNEIRFPLDAWYEDTLVCSVLYRMAKKIAVIEQPIYGYRINPEGISKTARSSAKSIDHYWVMEHALELSDRLGLEHDEVLYDLVFNHMSTFLYRRMSLMQDEVIKATFLAACNMLDKIRPDGYLIEGNIMKKDLEKAFQTRNYKLWKLASFLV